MHASNVVDAKSFRKSFRRAVRQRTKREYSRGPRLSHTEASVLITGMALAVRTFIEVRFR